MEVPRSRQELEQIIADQIPESARLEYKASAALTFPRQTIELAKDVSAMANSDGGVIIYGIPETDQHLPGPLDGGTAHADVTKERLEQLIISNVRPRPDCEIVQIPLSAERSAFVVVVSRSDRPLQNAVDKKYYKRFNFSAHPMEDYEIEDVRGRRENSEAAVQITMEAGTYVVYFVVENVSRWPAFEVSFTFPEELRPWLEKEKAPALTRGLHTLPAGRRLRFFYGPYNHLVAENSPFPRQFDISVSYRTSPDGRVKVETLHVDLMDYFGSNLEKSDAEELGEQIKKGFDSLTKQVERLAGLFDQHVGPMSAPSGVTLSVTALRNLRYILAGTDRIEKVHPTDHNVVQELLQVDPTLAFRIWEFFRWPPANGSLEALEGVTPELASKIRSMFVLPAE
jgi:hypothetical protein